MQPWQRCAAESREAPGLRGQTLRHGPLPRRPGASGARRHTDRPGCGPGGRPGARQTGASPLSGGGPAGPPPRPRGGCPSARCPPCQRCRGDWRCHRDCRRQRPPQLAGKQAGKQGRGRGLQTAGVALRANHWSVSPPRLRAHALRPELLRPPPARWLGCRAGGRTFQSRARSAGQTCRGSGWNPPRRSQTQIRWSVAGQDWSAPPFSDQA